MVTNPDVPMTEPQDILAEALHEEKEAFFGYKAPCELVSGCDCRVSAPAILLALAARGYALVRTPETLDGDTAHLALPPDPERCWPGCPHSAAATRAALVRTPETLDRDERCPCCGTADCPDWQAYVALRTPKPEGER